MIHFVEVTTINASTWDSPRYFVSRSRLYIYVHISWTWMSIFSINASSQTHSIPSKYTNHLKLDIMTFRLWNTTPIVVQYVNKIIVRQKCLRKLSITFYSSLKILTNQCIAPGRCGCYLKLMFEHFLLNCPDVTVRRSPWYLVNVCSGNGWRVRHQNHW